MVERMKKELDIKKIDIKEETFTVEEICTVYVQEEDVKMETIEIKGKIFKNLFKGIVWPNDPLEINK